MHGKVEGRVGVHWRTRSWIRPLERVHKKETVGRYGSPRIAKRVGSQRG